MIKESYIGALERVTIIEGAFEVFWLYIFTILQNHIRPNYFSAYYNILTNMYEWVSLRMTLVDLIPHNSA